MGQGSDFPVQKFGRGFLIKLDVPCRDVNLPSPVTTGSTVACVEAGRTIKVLLELVKLNVVIPSSADRVWSKCELTWNQHEGAHLLTMQKIQ